MSLNNSWSRGTFVPNAWSPDLGPGGQAYLARVKALHHWIRKGNSEKAALTARIVARHAFALLARHGGR